MKATLALLCGILAAFPAGAETSGAAAAPEDLQPGAALERVSAAFREGPTSAKRLPAAMTLYPLIQPGMTRSDVLNRLGVPDSAKHGNLARFLNYSLGEGRQIEIEFSRNTEKVIRKRETGLGLDPPPVPPPPIPADRRAYVADYAVTGTTIRAGFVPVKTRSVWGEPLEVTFTAENLGPGDFEFLFGGDYRGTGRHDRFKIEVTDDAGRLLPDPHANAPDFGGLMSRELLTPGGETFTRVLDLTRFRTIEQPGAYTVSCRFALAAQPLVQSSYNLTILARTPERVAQVLDEAVASALAAPEAELAALLKRLALFGREDALTRLATLAQTGPAARRTAALSALPLVPADGALDVALAGLKDADPVIRGAAAAALGEMRHPRGVEALLQALAAETSPVKAAVLLALGASKSARALSVLADTLEHGTPALRTAAVPALVANGGPEAIATLVRFAEDGDLLLRYQVVLALADKLRQPLQTDWLLPVLMCRQEDHGGWYDTLRLLRMYGGAQAVPALLSGLDFDMAWSGRNWWILEQVKACPNAPQVNYEHDPNANGTPETCARNLGVLAELKKLAGPIAARPAWPKRERPADLKADPPIDFEPVLTPLENGAEIQAGFFRTSKHRGGASWTYTPSPAYARMYKTAEAARDLILHPERFAAAGITAEQAGRLRQLALPPAYPIDDSGALLQAYLEAPPGPVKERAVERLGDAIRLVSQRRHAEIAAFVEAVGTILAPEQMARLAPAP